MRFSAKDRYIYTPEFNGNRDIPESDRMTFEIIRPKAEERGDLSHIDTEREISLSDGAAVKSAPITFKRRYNYGKIFRSHIGKITNVEAELPSGKIVPVTDGPAFADSPLFGIGGLTLELCNEVISDVLTEEEKKSSASPLSLSTMDGTAKSGGRSMTKNEKNSLSDSSEGESSKTT